MTSLNKIDLQTIAALALIVLAMPVLLIWSWGLRASERDAAINSGDYWAN